MHTPSVTPSPASEPQERHHVPLSPDEQFLAGGGDMGALVRSIDWSTTPVGPVSSWPQSLRTTVSTILNSKFGMFLWWGPDLVQFYNDAYRPSFGAEGEKHPHAMGQRGAECWGEIWEIIFPQIEQVMTQGIATWHENHLVPIYRNGILEEVYWTYTYSPIFDESGSVGGVLVVEAETTRQVIGERRTKLLRDLSVALTTTATVAAVCAAAMDALATDAHDLPFALLYLRDARVGTLNLVASTGLVTEDTARPATIDRTAPDPVWPVWDVVAAGEAMAVHSLRLPGGPWPEMTTNALLLPLTLPNQLEPTGVLICGVSPRQPLDRGYRDYFTATAMQIVSGIASASAHEAEVTRQTELEHARAETEIARQRLYNLFMHAPAFVAVLSGPDLVFEIANPRYRQLLGSDRPLDGIPLMIAVPDIEPSLVQIIRDVATRGERFVANELPVRLDWDATGTPYTKYLNFVYEPLFDTDHHPDGLMFFGYEVTEQVDARRIIAESEARFRRLAEAMPQKIFTATANGEFNYCNPQWTGFTGLSFAAIRDGGWVQFVHPDEVEETRRSWKDSIDTGVAFEREHRFRRADGAYRWHLSRAVPIHDVVGGVELWIGTNTDIDAQKHAEAALRESEVQREQFLVHIAHDLKSPLTTIKATAQLVARQAARSGEATARMTARLDSIDSAATRMTTMIDELLDVARIRAGRPLELTVEAIDLIALVRVVIAEHEERRTHRFSLSTTEPDLVGEWDVRRLERVIENLFSNACKYSARGSTIAVTLGCDDRWATLAVADTGIGIPAVDLPHITERFYRAANAIGVADGTGIGLAGAKQIVEQQGGTIAVASEEGMGTTITIRLPRVR